MKRIPPQEPGSGCPPGSKFHLFRSTATKIDNDDDDDESHQIHNDDVESHQIHNDDESHQIHNDYDDESHLCVLTLLLALPGDTAAATNGHRDTLTSGEDYGLDYVAHNAWL